MYKTSRSKVEVIAKVQIL